MLMMSILCGTILASPTFYEEVLRVGKGIFGATPTTISSSSHSSAVASEETTIKIDPKYVELADRIARDVRKDQECYFTSKELFEHAVAFANDYLYPNNVAQAESINSTYFAENAVGRIDVTRNFKGRELNTEYLFGLFTQLNNSHIATLLGYSIAYDLYEFVGNCNEYSMSVVNNATFPTTGGKIVPFSVNIWIKLNKYKQIEQYDLSFLKFDRFFEIVELGAYQVLSGNKEATEIPPEGFDLLKSVLVKSVCEVHDFYCQKDYPQYASKEDCVDFLMHTRLGKSGEGGRDSVWCRSIHQNMIAYRPHIHCPHLGPSGGGMCTDVDSGYEQVVFNYNSTFEKNWVVV